MRVNNFKGYLIDFTPQAEKEFKKIEPYEAKKINDKLDELIAGQQNVDVEKMAGHGNEVYRLKCGKYRVIFEAQRKIITILIFNVAHRKEVYRKY